MCGQDFLLWCVKTLDDLYTFSMHVTLFLVISTGTSIPGFDCSEELAQKPVALCQYLFDLLYLGLKTRCLFAVSAPVSCDFSSVVHLFSLSPMFHGRVL